MVANTSDNAPAKEVLRAQCKEKGSCIPTGPARHRHCFRCGDPIPVPALGDISKLINASPTPAE